MNRFVKIVLAAALCLTSGLGAFAQEPETADTTRYAPFDEGAPMLGAPLRSSTTSATSTCAA